MRFLIFIILDIALIYALVHFVTKEFREALKDAEFDTRRLLIPLELDDYGIEPTRAHEADAGFDIFSPIDCTLWANDSLVVKTGVHVEIPRGYVGFLKSKSGLNVRNGITGEGVIDSGYTGEIVVKLRMDESAAASSHHFQRGDKLIQIVFLPIAEVAFLKVPTLTPTERGNNGFGSSGR